MATVAFRGALGRIGWTVEAANRFIAEGFNRIDDIGTVDKSFLKEACAQIRKGRAPMPPGPGFAGYLGIMPVQIPMMAEYKLYGMHLWVMEKLRHGTVITAIEFTAQVGNAYAEKYRKSSESDGKKDDESVKIPEPFGKDTEWRAFYKLLINYLGSKTGRNDAPLEYIARANDDPENEAEREEPYATEHERLVKTTPLTGTAFEHDNGTVWSIIKQLTLKSPAYAYITQYDSARDGRAAIKALTSHYEGTTQISKARAQAYEEIRTAEYHGERRNFTFENYVHRHTKAHKTLEEYGEIISEQKKVSDFLNGIKSADSNMLAGKAAAHTDAKYNQDFTECSNFMLNFIQAQSKPNARNISATDSNSRARGKKPFKGKGKGRGSSPTPNSNPATTYSPGKWKQLTKEQQDDVRRLRKKELSDDKKRPRNASAVASKEKKTDDSSSDGSQDPGSQFASANKGKKGKR